MLSSTHTGGAQARAHSFYSIPREMRLYRQFVVWRYVKRDNGKPTKVLFSPISGLPASSTNPQSWASFTEAVATYEAGGFDGIGFVFTRSDPYAGIDLDDAEGDELAKQRQAYIFDTFDGYAEVSPSGRGLHIIVRGNIPKGRRCPKIEVYSSERYFTMTGNVYRAGPIMDHDARLNMLWHDMGKAASRPSHGYDAIQTAGDAEIIDRASRASNGELFHALNTGQWHGRYQSQSDADFAYIDILAFYSQNREQLRRIFRASPLGARAKAHRANYVDPMIERAFDRLPPPVDTRAIVAALEAAIEAKRIASGGAA